MTYTRLYTNSEGESRFATVSFEFTSTDYVSDAAPVGLSSILPAAHMQFMKAPAGWSSDWHASAKRTLFVVISGEWEVTAGDGETRTFEPGSVLLAEDTLGKGHRSRVVSECDSVAVMIQLG